MLVNRFNLRLMIYPFEEFRVPAKGAYSTTLGVGGFTLTMEPRRLFSYHTRSQIVAVATGHPTTATSMILVSQSSRSLIGPRVHHLGGEMVVDPSFLPFSTVLSPNATVPHQPVFYNIPKSEEQKNVPRSGPRYRQYKSIQHHRLPKPQH